MRHAVKVHAGPAPSMYPQPRLICTCGWLAYLPNGISPAQVRSRAERHVPKARPKPVPAPVPFWQLWRRS